MDKINFTDIPENYLKGWNFRVKINYEYKRNE